MGCLESFGVVWAAMHGFAGDRLGMLGFVWHHLGSLGIVWDRLGLSVLFDFFVTCGAVVWEGLHFYGT